MVVEIINGPMPFGCELRIASETAEIAANFPRKPAFGVKPSSNMGGGVLHPAEVSLVEMTSSSSSDSMRRIEPIMA
jgi:hypothetical protein